MTTVARTFVGTIKDGRVVVELDRRPDAMGRLNEPPKPPNRHRPAANEQRPPSARRGATARSAPAVGLGAAGVVDVPALSAPDHDPRRRAPVPTMRIPRESFVTPRQIVRDEPLGDPGFVPTEIPFIASRVLPNLASWGGESTMATRDSSPLGGFAAQRTLGEIANPTKSSGSGSAVSPHSAPWCRFQPHRGWCRHCWSCSQRCEDSAPCRVVVG